MYELADRANLLTAFDDRIVSDDMLWAHVPNVTLPMGLRSADGTLTENEAHIHRLFTQLCKKPAVHAPKRNAVSEDDGVDGDDDDGGGGAAVNDDDDDAKLGNMKRYKFNPKMGKDLCAEGRRLLATIGAQRKAVHAQSLRRREQQTLAVNRCVHRRERMVETLRAAIEEEAQS